MANKIIAILLGLMFLMTLTPMVLAEDLNTNENADLNIILDSNINPIDEREARSILSPYGAEVRMLQLEKSVTRNVLIGNIILQVIVKNHADANILQAENTLNTMEMLLEEIKSSPTEGDKNVLIQTFVELKKEARTLSSAFKKQTMDFLTQTDRSEIMQQIKEIDRNQLNQFNERIKEKVRNFNSEKIKEKFNTMGVKNEDIIEKIKNGDANLKEIKEYALNKFKDLNSTEQKRIASKIKNDSIKKIIEQKQITQRIMNNFKEKLINNIQIRNGNLKEWMGKKGYDLNQNNDINQVQKLINQNNRIEELIQNKEMRNGGNRE